jgi:hypothetical protein
LVVSRPNSEVVQPATTRVESWKTFGTRRRVRNGFAELHDYTAGEQLSERIFDMKKNLLKYAFVVLGLAFCTCTVAHAVVFGGHVSTPEVDPSLAIGGLTLLAGTLAVLRTRRGK